MKTKETRSWYIFRVIQKSTFLVYIMILMVSVLSCVDTQAQQSKSFVIQQIEAQPGQTVSGKLIVEKGIDQGTFIPVTIINGQNPGPVLSLTAGIHGTEYVPIIALQELINEIDPKDFIWYSHFGSGCEYPCFFKPQRIYKSYRPEKS